MPFEHKLLLGGSILIIGGLFWAYGAYVLRKCKVVGSLGFERKTLLTGNEIDFLKRLERALAGTSFRVLPQVSMGAVMNTTLTPAHPKYWEVRSSFSSKIIDFVICDERNYRPLLVVELDDRMHDFDRDRSRDALLAKSGLRTVRFWSRKKPQVPELREFLIKHLGTAVKYH